LPKDEIGIGGPHKSFGFAIALVEVVEHGLRYH
jgi:hypothetical protein